MTTPSNPMPIANAINELKALIAANWADSTAFELSELGEFPTKLYSVFWDGFTDFPHGRVHTLIVNLSWPPSGDRLEIARQEELLAVWYAISEQIRRGYLGGMPVLIGAGIEVSPDAGGLIIELQVTEDYPTL